MVTELDRTPNLTPVPPDWMARRDASKPSQNRNINPIYWKKGPKAADPGWIFIGPSDEMGQDGRMLMRQAEAMLRKGNIPLRDYSLTNKVDPVSGDRLTIDNGKDRGDQLNSPDKWYWLFQNGGAHLFPIEQIVAYHWHITPPFGLPKSVFPQLDEYEVPEPFYCPACPSSRPPKNSVQEVVQHLMVQHQQNLPQVRDLQQATNDFRTVPVGASGLAIRRKDDAAQPVELTPIPEASVSTAKLKVCNNCGESISGRLADHRCSE